MAEHDEQITYMVDSPELRRLCEADKQLSMLIARYGDLSYTLHQGGFAFIVETIIGQMLSNKAADAITARLYSLCDGNLSPSVIDGLTQQTVKGIGLSNQKAAYIRGFAQLIRKKPDFFADLLDMCDDEVIKCLTKIHGIGVWSAKMYLIFVLNRLDVLPFEDGAFLQAYKWLYATDNVDTTSIINNCRPWRPYSSLAARYLYRALDERLTQDVELTARLCEVRAGLAAAEPQTDGSYLRGGI